jgi:L-fucose isomerase-like protein
MLSSSKILIITRREANPAKYLSPQYVNLVKQKLGVSLEYVDYSEVKALYDEVDMGAAERLAKEFMEKAIEVREPQKSEIVKAAAIYMALRKLLDRHDANALAIDCLGWLEYGKVEMPTTPCLALSLLNDEGFVAACEADVHSALTMLIFRYLADRPSFISDPVVDTAENVVIHCHCTAPTKMDGQAARYVIRNHADSGDGVGLQVFMHEGAEVTVAKFIEGLNEMVVSVGRVLGNVDIDRGCRTKVKVSVPDARRYLYGYKGGLHRVLAYGNHLAALEDLSRFMGFTLTLEG